MPGGKYCSRVELWKNCANEKSKKLLRSWRANPSIGSELQMCIFTQNSSVCFARDSTGSFSVLGWLWSTEIKELPLPKWTVLLVLSILPFQQGHPSPVNTDTILSLWISRSGWFSTFIYNWAFVQVISVLLMLLITADCTAFQQQPEPLLTWKAGAAVVYIEWEVWTRNEQEAEYQVPSLVLEIVVNFWGQLQIQHL